MESQVTPAQPSDHDWNVILNEGEGKEERKVRWKLFHVKVIKKLSKGAKDDLHK